MAVDMFLKITGIEGESTDAKHKGSIDIESFSWGATQQGTTGSPGGGGAGAGKVQMQDFHFVMRSSKASPKLFQAVASGQHIKEAILTARKAGGKEQIEFLKIKFSDILVSSYQQAASSPRPPLRSDSDLGPPSRCCRAGQACRRAGRSRPSIGTGEKDRTS